MATFDRMYGGIEIAAIGKLLGTGFVIHLRHPINAGAIMCGLDAKLVLPIGSVPGDDPALHPECLAAWREARRNAQPGDTVKSS